MTHLNHEGWTIEPDAEAPVPWIARNASGEEVGALTFADLLFEIAEVEAWA